MCPLMAEDARTRIARRAAQELVPGQVVNLGVGIPNLIPRFLGAESGVHIQTENGLLGVGPPPRSHEVDGDLIDAAKQPVTALAGAAYFDSAESFAMGLIYRSHIAGLVPASRSSPAV